MAQETCADEVFDLNLKLGPHPPRIFVSKPWDRRLFRGELFGFHSNACSGTQSGFHPAARQTAVHDPGCVKTPQARNGLEWISSDQWKLIPLADFHHLNRGPKESPSMGSLHLDVFTQPRPKTDIKAFRQPINLCFRECHLSERVRRANAGELVSPEPETETQALAPSILCVIFSRLFGSKGALWLFKLSRVAISF